MGYSLYLYPEVAENKPVLKSELSTYLVEHQLATPSNTIDVLDPGQQLMVYINFLGCSPSLSSGESTTSIKIHQFEGISAMGGQSVETIRYPGCKHPVNEPAMLLNNYPLKEKWSCNQCGKEGRLDQINWRKSAGFSTLFIEITSIFPKEAIPTEKLLNLLHNFSQSNWSWFYSSSSD